MTPPRATSVREAGKKSTHRMAGAAAAAAAAGAAAAAAGTEVASPTLLEEVAQQLSYLSPEKQQQLQSLIYDAVKAATGASASAHAGGEQQQQPALKKPRHTADAGEPKFLVVRDRAKEAPGPVLVYTDFRKVEGVGLFSRFLLANGWAELQLRRDDAKWGLEGRRPGRPAFMQLDTADAKEHQSLVLKIFNSQFDALPPELAKALGGADNLHGDVAKMLIVTKSAAEGISLSNVRQVHIMEPYWNSVRMQQIIGRAVRAHSHARLPAAERRVDVFMYLMQLTAEQKEDYQLKTFDRGLSTDEAVFAIAQRKQKIIDQFLDCLRRAAVDCVVHGSSDCFQYPAHLPPSALVAPVTFRDNRPASRLASAAG